MLWTELLFLSRQPDTAGRNSFIQLLVIVVLVCCENDPQLDQPTVGLSSVDKDYVMPDALLYKPSSEDDWELVKSWVPYILVAYSEDMQIDIFQAVLSK